jgi:hypothetical protein
MKETRLLLIIGSLLVASFFSDFSKTSSALPWGTCYMCWWDENLRAYCEFFNNNGWTYCQAINGPSGGSCNMVQFCQ